LNVQKKMKPPPEPTTFPPPPAHLSPRAAELWRVVGPQHALSAPRQALLLVGLESLDRAESARQLLAGGELVGGTGKISHAHPAVKIEFDARAQFFAAWSALGIGSSASGTTESFDVEGFLRGKRK
jgi:phage terminase small subunit